LKEELQHMRSGTSYSHTLQLWCFGSVVLVVLSVLSFACSRSCSLSIRSSVSVSSVLSENMDTGALSTPQ
jgi:hypothetical protein